MRKFPRQKLHLLLLFTACVLPVARAQTAAPDEPGTLHVSTQLVLLDVAVEDRRTGTQVGPMRLEDFELREEGVPQTLRSINANKQPLSLLFLFDITDSVRPVLRPLAESARAVLDHMGPQDEAAVSVFSSHTTPLVGFTHDRARLAQEIDRAAEMGSREAMFAHESMWEAVQASREATIADSRRVTVWLTDGLSNTENEHMRKRYGPGAPEHLHPKVETTTALLQSGMVVSALIERSELSDALSPLSAIGLGGHTGEIAHYAELTGGPVLHTSVNQVAARLGLLIDMLRTRSTLAFRPSVNKPKGTLCHLSLTLTPAFFAAHPDLKRSDAVVRTRQEYVR